MTLFCLSTAIITTALLAVFVYALCAAASRADAISDMLAEQARRQSEGKVHP